MCLSQTYKYWSQWTQAWKPTDDRLKSSKESWLWKRARYSNSRIYDACLKIRPCSSWFSIRTPTPTSIPVPTSIFVSKPLFTLRQRHHPSFSPVSCPERCRQKGQDPDNIISPSFLKWGRCNLPVSSPSLHETRLYSKSNEFILPPRQAPPPPTQFCLTRNLRAGSERIRSCILFLPKVICRWSMILPKTTEVIRLEQPLTWLPDASTLRKKRWEDWQSEQRKQEDQCGCEENTGSLTRYSARMMLEITLPCRNAVRLFCDMPILLIDVCDNSYWLKDSPINCMRDVMPSCIDHEKPLPRVEPLLFSTMKNQRSRKNIRSRDWLIDVLIDLLISFIFQPF